MSVDILADAMGPAPTTDDESLANMLRDHAVLFRCIQICPDNELGPISIAITLSEEAPWFGTVRESGS